MNKAFDETAVTADQQEALRARVRAELERTGEPKSAAAKEAGVAYSTFTAWLDGTYGGRTDKVAADVRRWMDTRAARQDQAAALPEAPAFQRTPSAERMLAVLQYAQFASDMAVIAGGPGIGKTEVCRHYKATAANVWLVTMEPSTGGVGGLLRELCFEMRLEVREQVQLARRVCQRIEDTRGLIVVDEAQHLATAALDQLRAIHDRTGVGICIVGNEAVYARLEGGGRKAQFAQLFSRVGMRLTQAGPRDADIAMLADCWGATPEELKLLRAIARKPGALRGMTKTLALASMVARGAEQVRGPDHIRQAWARLAPDERLTAS